MHQYPFLSGASWITSSKPFKALAGVQPYDAWASVYGRQAMVPMDDYVGRVMFFAGNYDGKLSWILRRTIGADDVFYDIGADFLLYTMLASTRIGPNGEAHCLSRTPASPPIWMKRWAGSASRMCAFTRSPSARWLKHLR